MATTPICSSTGWDRNFPGIPHDVILHIFSFLSYRKQAALALVCHKWRLISGHKTLWKEIFPKLELKEDQFSRDELNHIFNQAFKVIQEFKKEKSILLSNETPNWHFQIYDNKIQNGKRNLQAARDQKWKEKMDRLMKLRHIFSACLTLSLVRPKMLKTAYSIAKVLSSSNYLDFTPIKKLADSFLVKNDIERAERIGDEVIAIREKSEIYFAVFDRLQQEHQYKWATEVMEKIPDPEIKKKAQALLKF